MVEKGALQDCWLPHGMSPAGGVQEDGRPAAARARRVLPQLLARARRLCEPALDVVFPPACIACGSATGTHAALCVDCWSGLRFIEAPICDRLGVPFAVDLGAGLISPEAFANPPVYQRARAAVCFEDGPAREIVHRLKYGDRVELARPMAVWMTRAGKDILDGADALVPTPLHWRRLFSRRFNQAALLARQVADLCGVAVDPMLLSRVRATAPQIGKTRAQRAENMQGAFRVGGPARARLGGRRVVLVDDVLTSGATANAAARALLRAGAAQVDVLVFGRVVRDL